MDTCGKCGGEGRIQPIPRHQVRKELMGGMHVELMDVVNALVCQKCGTTIRVDIPDMPGLIAAVSVARATRALKLNGDEIRFLRKAMDKSAKEMAQDLRVSDETVSRWENGHLLMGEPVERIFRWTVCTTLEDRAPGVDWEPEEVLTRMNILPVSSQPLVMHFQHGKKRKGAKRRQQWQEERPRKVA